MSEAAEQGHVVVEHTADSGIEAWARDLPGLFVEAAAAMFELMYEAKAAGDVEAAIVVEVGADSVEELLVAWLSELLFVSETRDLALSVFEVDQISPTSLRGRTGGPTAGRVGATGPPIKAVTYHGLLIEHDTTWRARVIFDV